MNRNDFKPLADKLQSSEEVVRAIARLVRIRGSDATEENIVAVWHDPNSEQRDWIKKRAMLLALANGLETGDELCWGDESFFIIEKFEQLADKLQSSEEVVRAMARLLSIEGSDVTEENIVAIWGDPNSKQRDWIKKRAMLLALANGLETGDELFWGEETFVITI